MDRSQINVNDLLYIKYSSLIENKEYCVDILDQEERRRVK